MFLIKEKRILNEFVTLMKIDAPFVAKKAKAGQFIILKINETGERIPLTIADFDEVEGTVTIIFQNVGMTTQKLSKMNEGDFIQDFVGPLGKASELDNVKKACVIGGGVGCAISYPQAKSLKKLKTEVDMIVGFRSKDIVILEEEMKAVSDNFIITTDDGSYGKKGFVTSALKELIENGSKYDLVIAIGPIPMMKAICEVTKQYNIKTVVSLNPIMIDGTGMCGGCRVNVNGEIKFACVDGPDFDGHAVDFDELMHRNIFYKKQEVRSADCNLMKNISK